MSGMYHDESLPIRRGGHNDRPLDSWRRSRDKKSPGSSWKIISEEELYGGFRRRVPDAASGSAPGRFRTLLKMTEHYVVDEAERTSSFLRQARFMAEYEDTYLMRGIPIKHIFVGYQEMSADELRGYFTWRTRIRRGEKATGARDFIRLYAAELINLVGVSSAQESFDNLLRLQAIAAPPEHTPMDTFLKNVLRDFVIVYNLDHDLALEWCIDDPQIEAAYLALDSADTADDYSLYAAIRTLVGEQIEASRFLPQAEEDACHVIARTVRTLSANEKAKKGKGSGIIGRLLGSRKGAPHTMFAWLPFQTDQPDGYVYEVDPVRSYEYREGRWYCCSYPSWRNPDELKALSGIVRECERLLRKALHYKNALPDKRKDPQTAELIGGIIEEWLKEKAVRNRPEVRIDLTKLSGIRERADITRDRLLEGTEEAEEMADPADILWTAMAAPTVAGPDMIDSNISAPETTVPAMTAPDLTAPDMSAPASIFTPEEQAFLQLLLEGQPWKDFISDRQLMLSVFVDGINEKAYDEIGDSILEIEDGIPVLIEDYIEDLQDLL